LPPMLTDAPPHPPEVLGTREAAAYRLPVPPPVPDVSGRSASPKGGGKGTGFVSPGPTRPVTHVGTT
jgi:hypothetical protein